MSDTRANSLLGKGNFSEIRNHAGIVNLHKSGELTKTSHNGFRNSSLIPEYSPSTKELVTSKLSKRNLLNKDTLHQSLEKHNSREGLRTNDYGVAGGYQTQYGSFTSTLRPHVISRENKQGETGIATRGDLGTYSFTKDQKKKMLSK